MNEIMIVC